MHFSGLVAFAAIFSKALASPASKDSRGFDGGAPVVKRDACNRDNLLRSFVDPRYSSCASAYCTGYLGGPSPTAPCPNTNFGSFQTAGPSRISSACNCIITPTGTCSVQGYAPTNYIGYLSNSGTQADCKALCLSTAGCKAYAFGTQDGGSCEGYTDIVANDGFYADASSQYLFYDNSCPA